MKLAFKSLARSNRTFMELKFSIVRMIPFTLSVLIVPLWN